RWHRDLAAAYGFAERDRQIKMNVIAFAAEKGMGPDSDLDQGVAVRAAAGPRAPLTPKPDLLAFLHVLRDFHIQRLAVFKRDLPPGALNGVQKIDGDLVNAVKPAFGHGPASPSAGPPARASAAAHAVENIGEN